MMKQHISVLIVDDEPEARDLLSLLLNGFSDMEVIASADGVDQAMEVIRQQAPDLVLLDIQMPEKDGFELVRQVHEMQTPTGFIFVTAYDEFAIQAIRASAFDYLLKPVDPAELKDAIERYRETLQQNKLPGYIQEMLAGVLARSRIKVNTRTGFIVMEADDLVYCKASGNYTQVQLSGNREEMITCNLGSFTEKLPAKQFFRISRSAIINLKYLMKVDNKSGICKLKGDPPVILKVARNRRHQLEQICTGFHGPGDF